MDMCVRMGWTGETKGSQMKEARKPEFREVMGKVELPRRHLASFVPRGRSDQSYGLRRSVIRSE